MPRLCALVVGSLGAWDVGVGSMVMSMGKIPPQIQNFVTMVRGQVGDAEGVAHGVLVEGDLDVEGVAHGVLCHHGKGPRQEAP